MRSLAFSWATLCALSACKHAAPEPDPPPVAVHCVSAKPESIDETLALRGRIEPPPGGDLPVASQVSGRIISVIVREGQHIVNGDLVATVDGAASLDALRQADAAVAQARASVANAEATLERTRALVARGIAAKQELDDTVAREEAAKAGLAAALAAADLARRTLGRVQVRSSFEGVVTRIWRGPGALVDGTAATPVVQLTAQGAAEFVADATERELARVQEGQPVHGTLVSGADDFEGTVRVRSTALDPSTGLGTVRVTIAPPSASIPIGTFGRVVITTAHRAGVLVLPAAALRGAVADGAELALCKDGKAELRTVKVGWRDDTRFEVLEGVGPNDRAAVDHVLGLDDGTAIEELK
jgi:RND family efflux transporter MFP subunit